MKKKILAFTSVFLLICLFYTLPIAQLAQLQSKKSNLFTRKKDSNTSLQVLVARPVNDPTKNLDSKDFAPPTKDEVDNFLSGKDKKANKALFFRKFRKMLLAKNVPFEPNLLLEDDWAARIKKKYPNFVKSLKSVRPFAGKISGAIIADTLYLPEKTEISGDTVILANRIAFEGKNVVIKGHHDICLMPIDSMVTTEKAGLRNQPYIFEADNPEFEKEFFSKNTALDKVNITIDTSGFGSEEWKAQNALKNNKSKGFQLLDQDNSGGQGCAGNDGEHMVSPAPNGTDSLDPLSLDGSCVLSGFTNGKNNINATDGRAGEKGGNAPSYGQAGGPCEGGSANAILASIPTGTTGTVNLFANGGKGGTAGNGGLGQHGGDGGQGKRGGDGITCVLQIGNGGNGGNGGEGGNGGKGGNGGNGGRGGDGADISGSYPATVSVNAQANKGDGGDGGYPGPGGQPGDGKSGGRGGNPGNTIGGNYGNPGTDGMPKGSGNYLGNGDPGNNGAKGNKEGTINLTPSTIGGGGVGGCFASSTPGFELDCGGSSGGGGGGGYCTPYYWVLYVSWDGGRTWEMMDMWEAGCW